MEDDKPSWKKIISAEEAGNRTTWGTASFINYFMAIKYFRHALQLDEVQARDMVAKKLRNGEIFIGVPRTNRGQQITLIDQGTRWAVVEPAKQKEETE